MQFGENAFHIVRSDGAAAELKDCFGLLRDRLLIDYDNLAHGPLVPHDNTATWQLAREAFWRELPDQFGFDEHYNFLGTFPARLEAERDRLADAETIYLWLGPLLSEVLLLGFILTVFNRLQIDPARIRLVDLSPVRTPIGVEPSIGSLSCKYLKQIGPWRGLNDGHQTAYRELWLAVAAPAPDRLVAIGGSSAYPEPIGTAAKAYMARYPSTASGLGFWEQRTLDKCKDSRQKVARIVGDIFGDTLELSRDKPDWPNDRWLFHRLKRMADPALPHPLVKLYGKGEKMRETEVNLTDAGRAVLAGEANAIALNGIEDRIGGVTLTKEKHWLFDGNTLIPGGTEG